MSEATNMQSENRALFTLRGARIQTRSKSRNNQKQIENRNTDTIEKFESAIFYVVLLVLNMYPAATACGSLWGVRSKFKQRLSKTAASLPQKKKFKVVFARFILNHQK